MVITPQRSIALLGIRPNWWRPDKVRVIPDEGEESVVGDVQWGKLRRFPLPFLLFSGALMVISLAPLLFRLPLLGRLDILGGNHHCLGGRPNIVFQRRVPVRPSV